MIYDELPTAWPFATNLDKLTANSACPECNIQSLKTTTLVLPGFIWRGPVAFMDITSFILRDTGNSAITINLVAEIPNLQVFVINADTYIVWRTKTYTAMTTPLDVGTYQVEISDGTYTIYSEPMEFCSSETRCLQLIWGNTCDIAGIPYTYLAANGGPWTNWLMLTDAALMTETYETENEKFENGLRQLHTFYVGQKRFLRFRETAEAKWYAKMFQAMQIHNNISIDFRVDTAHPQGLYSSGRIEEMIVITSPVDEQQDLCRQFIDVSFRQDDAIIGTMCCVSNQPAACDATCFNVDGFKADFVGIEQTNHFYIDDTDSGLIYQWNGSAYVLASSTCFFVHNITTVPETNMFFDGDFWHYSPLLIINGVIAPTLTDREFDMQGYTRPDTWSYIYYRLDPMDPWQDVGSNPGGPGQPLTSTQLQVGFIITLSAGSGTYYFRITSQNHTCTYDEGTTQVNA
jgi:hypothetical protein